MAAQSLTGRQISGYDVHELIARGGMSQIYRAEHRWMARTVALKILSPDLAGDERFRERFMRESRVVAELDHPNIVPVYDAGEFEGFLYIAMRLVDGSDLRKLLVGGPLGAERTLGIMEQVAAGVDEAHSRGLVHRDLKPANILVDTTGRAYVADFGVARAETSAAMTQTSEFVGSRAYAAPEQFRGEVPDARTDIYALGCVLYECLAGAPPYDRPSEAAVMYAHLEEPPPTLPSGRDVPETVDAVVHHALAKRREDRYPSALALADDFRHSLAQSPGTPVRAFAETVVERSAAPEAPPAQPPTRRGRRGLFAAMILLIVLAAGAAAAALSNDRVSHSPHLAPVTRATSTSVTLPTTSVTTSSGPQAITLIPTSASFLHTPTQATAGAPLVLKVRVAAERTPNGRCVFARVAGDGRSTPIGRPVSLTSDGVCTLETIAPGDAGTRIFFRVAFAPAAGWSPSHDRSPAVKIIPTPPTGGGGGGGGGGAQTGGGGSGGNTPG